MKFLRFLGVFAVLFGLGFGVAHADDCNGHVYTITLDDGNGTVHQHGAPGTLYLVKDDENYGTGMFAETIVLTQTPAQRLHN